ncbi:peptidylprolyl isomerase [Urechidicola vernalis]|uniref:Peptidyl-prolyl cis-trans isomerase n=1 Tax=Urechidicola vernalis TaxID=3075600 RepID=A0ABU2Y1T8_9FLAO|nr:peptidylprolyl isomerase [Urechidicola sp. P050]MDT0551771.1 peptidylprolyl isomerase [Urechidicola sp. P050]
MIKILQKTKQFILLCTVSIVFYNCNQNSIECVIETDKGDIIIELYPEKAPITVANFLKYVDANKYENSAFFRVCNTQNEAERTIPIEVIQGGLDENAGGFPPIKIETTKETGLKHENGTLSMARLEPNTATDSFFICTGSQPELDFGGKRNPDGQGFAAFGKVTKGMDVVKAIQRMKDTSQYLVEPVVIKNIKRIQ